MKSTCATIGWGLYCACSWTWCIGMFLPVVMLQRYGWTGYFVFAIPNVIGCAAFGYVLRNRENSKRFLSRHGIAATWFSIVTVAYHMFFWVFLAMELLEQFPSPVSWLQGANSAMLALAALILLTVAGLLLSRLRESIWPWFAAAVWITSISIFVVLLGRESSLSTIEPTKSLAQTPWLLPIVAFGFGLCPYLDLTFHRALQESPSRHAFGVFGLTFAAMIAMTCVVWFARERTETLTLAALCHLMLQSIFTVAVHIRAVWQSPAPAFSCSKRRSAAIALPVAIGLLYFGFRFLSDPTVLPGEGNYMRFLAFYGLVFPLYVWLFACFPLDNLGRTRLVFIILLIVMAPIYELGFIHDRPWLFLAAFIAYGTIAWKSLHKNRSDGSLTVAADGSA